MKKSNKLNKSKKNMLNEKLKDLDEWEENQYNPGYYIGTGRVSKPIKGIGKNPVIQLSIGLIILISSIIAIIDSANVLNIISFAIPIIIGFILVYSAIIRLINYRWENLIWFIYFVCADFGLYSWLTRLRCRFFLQYLVYIKDREHVK